MQLDNEIKRKTIEAIELDNEIKRETLKSMQNRNNSFQENDVNIKLLEKQIKELAGEKSCISEITHYIKGATIHDTETDLLYSKTVFENRKGSKGSDAQDEN
ncbi:MAG: hypothetical protein LBC70_09085 [Chitinispirillales bacterium]|jgi:hypothetical protein|nr:hypothetical protein [Chitinispirillales bacterium]